MSLIFLLPLLFLRIQAKYVNSTICDGFQANLNITSVFGTWYVASVMPNPDFGISWQNSVPCYKVEFTDIKKDDLSEIEEQSLKHESPMNTIESEGTLIRQTIFSERPVDLIWSIVVGVNGCYQQELGLDMKGEPLTHEISQSPAMQLHLIDGDPKRDITGPILMQVLWEETVNAVIYRRQMEYDPDDFVDTILDAMDDFRRKLTFPYPSYCEELFQHYTQK